MKNLRIALVAVAALGLGALLWRFGGQAPKPKPALVAQPTPAPPAAAAKLPTVPLELQPIVSEERPAVAPPEAPTLASAPVPRGMAIYARSLADGPRVLQMAIDRTGGARGLKSLRRATYEVLRVGGHGSAALELQCDERGQVVMTNRQTGQETGFAAGQCWEKKGQIIVPCERQQRALMQALGVAHMATALLPLQAPPWRIKAAGGARIDGKLANTLSFSDGASTELVLYLDPVAGRALRVVSMATHVDFGETQSFGFAQLPATRKFTLFDDDLQPALAVRILDRVSAVRPAVAAPRMKPPALTRFVSMRVGSRPALAVIRLAPGTHAGIDKAMQSFDMIPWEPGSQSADIYEVMGQPTSEQTLDLGVQVWVALPQSSISDNPRVRDRLEIVAAEPAVAMKVLRLPHREVAAAMLKFLGEVAAAGHKASGGRVAARYLCEPDPKTGDVTVELQVPVLAAGR